MVEKYVVHNLGGEVISDAVVIRLQDTFAPGALWAYANSVATVLDTMDHYGITDHGDLEEVHEYFRDMAIKADELYNRRLPTL